MPKAHKFPLAHAERRRPPAVGPAMRCLSLLLLLLLSCDGVAGCAMWCPDKVAQIGRERGCKDGGGMCRDCEAKSSGG